MKILIVRNMPNYMDVLNKTYNIQEIGLASALIRKGNICDIVFWTDKEEKTIELNVENSEKKILIYYKNSFSFMKNAIYKIDEIAKKYDIIQVSEYNQIESFIMSIKYPRKTVVYHGQYYGKENKKYNMWCNLINPIFIPFYKKKKIMFITKSKYSKDFMIDKGINKENVYALGVGIDNNSFKLSNKEKIPPEIDKIISNKNIKKILYVGEYASRRHIKFLGDIVKKLNNDGIKTVLITIGGTETEYGKECLEYFKQNNIIKYVEHFNKIEQKYLSKIYESCDCFLFPSTYEIFGMVLLEAMYYRLNVISCDNGGANMLIKDGINGFIINNLDLNEWVDRIKNIFNDINLRNKIGINANKTIINDFTWDSIVDNFIEVYNKSIKK